MQQYSNKKMSENYNFNLRMKDNQQESYSFTNPICKQTYNSLPKIYGGPKNQRSLRKIKVSSNTPSKHNCLLHQESTRNISPTNKKYSNAKSRFLSMPKNQKCKKKNCQCNLVHDEDPKTLRKAASNLVKKKIKLRPLIIAKPDDFQTEHKVAMKINTQPSMPTGLASIIASQRNVAMKIPQASRIHDESFINDIIDENYLDEQETRRNNNTIQDYTRVNIPKIPRSLTQEIAIGTMDNIEQIQSQPYSFQSSNLSRVTGLTTKQVACVEVQVDLINDAIQKRSQKSEEEMNVGTQTNQKNQKLSTIPQPAQSFQSQSNQPFSVRQKLQQSRFNKLRAARRSRFYISQEEQNQESQNYDSQQKKRRQAEQNRQNGIISRQSSSSLSLSSCLVKGLNSNTTQFQKLSVRQKKEGLKVSRAKSTKSNGTFRVPSQEDYVSYLKSYRILDKKNFNLKELVKKPLFSIVEQQEGVYFGEYENQSKVGSGIRVTQKQIFEGVYDKNVKIKGCERNIDGVYKGYFTNGKREGYGTFQWNNGQKFEGNWKQGVKCGFGIWRSPKGDSYEGQWLNNRQHGQGTFKHRNSTYKGEFENFLKHGRGQETFVNGDRYVGQYKFGKPDGKGIYTWHQGGYYEGEFKQGFRNGQGKYIEANGNIYTGQFLEDFKHGQGKQEYKTGDYFQGTFQNGKEVKGTLHKKQGKSQFIHIQ